MRTSGVPSVRGLTRGEKQEEKVIASSMRATKSRTPLSFHAHLHHRYPGLSYLLPTDVEPLQHADEAMAGPPDFMLGNAYLLRVGLPSTVQRRVCACVLWFVGSGSVRHTHT